MTTSTTIAEIAKALSAFQGELKPARKDESNPFFKMKYAGLSSIWETIREPLVRNGLSITQLPHLEEDFEHKKQLALTTLLLHSSGEWISSEMQVTALKPDPQSIGSALTYARRYALSAILGVSADDDDAEEAMGRKDTKPLSDNIRKATSPPKEKSSAVDQVAELAEQIKEKLAGELPEFKNGTELVNYALKHGWKMDKIRTALGIETPADIKDVKAASAVLFPAGKEV